MRTASFIAVILLVTPVSGCYLYYSTPKGRAKAPALKDGATIELAERSKSRWMDCTPSGRTGDSCQFEDGVWKRTTRWTQHTATYDGKPLTQGEVRALVDPKYSANWDRIDAKSRTCSLSLIPTAVAWAGVMVAGAAAIYAGFTTRTSTTDTVAYVGAGVGIGAGLLSIPLGGYACVSAHNLAVEVKAFDESATTFDDASWDRAGQQEVAEITTLVDNFNSRRGTAAATTSGTVAAANDGTTDSPVTKQPTAPATAPVVDSEFRPGTETIMNVLAGAGDFRDFSTLLVQIGLDKELASGGPYMVFAPTDAMLAKIPSSSWRTDKNELLDSLQGQIVIGVASAGKHEYPTIGGKTRTITFSSNGRIQIKSTRGTITLIGAATNAMVYRVE